MLESPGWQAIHALQVAWVEGARKDLRKLATSGPEALDALRRWQLAEDLIELEAKYINDTLAAAEDLRQGLTIEEALLMEQTRNEQQSSESGTANPTGY